VHIQAILTYKKNMGTSIRREKNSAKRRRDESYDQYPAIKSVWFWIDTHQRTNDERDA
jgi:hypothetical protein